MKDIFDRYYKRYDAWYDKNKLAYLSELEAIRKVLPKRGKGLEIGVGTGRFAKPLRISIGIDPSENMLKIAKSRGLETVPGKGEDLPFKDQEFDFVLIAITLCFVDNPEQVITESRRVLKDKGEIVVGIIDKNSHLGKSYQKKKSEFYNIANFYSTQEVINLVKEEGFRSIRVFQTIFSSPQEMKTMDIPKEGFGEGGFVVICGEKICQKSTHL